MYAPDNSFTKYARQELKEVDKPTIILVLYFNITLSVTDRITG